MSSQSTVPWCPRTGQPRTGCGGSSGQSAGSFLLTPRSVQCQSALTRPLPVTDTYPQPGRPAGKYRTHTTGSPVHSKKSYIAQHTSHRLKLESGLHWDFQKSMCYMITGEKSKCKIWGIKLGSEIENKYVYMTGGKDVLFFIKSLYSTYEKWITFLDNQANCDGCFKQTVVIILPLFCFPNNLVNTLVLAFSGSWLNKPLNHSQRWHCPIMKNTWKISQKVLDKSKWN